MTKLSTPTLNTVVHSIVRDGSTFTLTVSLDTAHCHESYANGPYRKEEHFPLSNLTVNNNERVAVLIMDYAAAAAASYHRQYLQDMEERKFIKRHEQMHELLTHRRRSKRASALKEAAERLGVPYEEYIADVDIEDYGYEG